MNKILSAAVVIIGFTASAALAQMGGHEGMGSQQSHQMTGGQMMGREMMQDMTGMMKQMNEMMQKMSHTMEHKTVTEHAKMQERMKAMNQAIETLQKEGK